MAKKKVINAVIVNEVAAELVVPTVAEAVTVAEIQEEPTLAELVAELETVAEAEASVVVEVVEEKVERRGRPVVAGSVRQLKLAGIAERIAAGAEIKRGRPVAATSVRQQKFADRAAKEAAGIKVGPGRPRMVKPEIVVVLPTVATVPVDQIAELITTPLEVIEGEI
jgi:hypothetical protein